MDTSLDAEFVAKSESIITQLGFKNLKSFVKNQALPILLAKIEKFEVENKHFEGKYGLGFCGFQERIERKENQEDFTEEDDYLDWRFAKEALERLKRQTRELEYA
jgi:hypothetical protein